MRRFRLIKNISYSGFFGGFILFIFGFCREELTRYLYFIYFFFFYILLYF